MAFAALLIDPWRHVAEVVELHDSAAPEPVTYTPGELADVFERDGRTFVVDAHKALTPRSHWLLIDRLLDGALLSLEYGRLMMAVFEVYNTGRIRGMLYTSDFFTHPPGTPGFALLDGKQPGIYWHGKAVLVLYGRRSKQPVSYRAFLEHTATFAISWLRVPNVKQHVARLCVVEPPAGNAEVDAFPRSYAMPICSGCNQYSEKLKRCAACARSHFCGLECHLAHWQVHKPRCIVAREV
jgi:hypothetical protein